MILPVHPWQIFFYFSSHLVAFFLSSWSILNRWYSYFLYCCMMACLEYSARENFLKSIAPFSATNVDFTYCSVYRNGTHFKELVNGPNPHVSYLPSCFNIDRRPLPLKLVKTGYKMVVVTNKIIGHSQYLHWPVIPQTLSPNNTGTYFCCSYSQTMSKECSSAGQATYKLQVVREHSNAALIGKWWSDMFEKLSTYGLWQEPWAPECAEAAPSLEFGV